MVMVYDINLEFSNKKDKFLFYGEVRYVEFLY